MLLKLLGHEWKALRRSSFWTQSLIQSIALAIFGLYFILMALGIGFAAGSLLEKIYPDSNVVAKFTSYFVLYLLVDLIMRFMLQKYPSMNLNHYLTLNIKKSTLTHFILIKSIGHYFNFLPLFAIVPFCFMHVLPNYGLTKSLVWLLVMTVSILVSNFLSFWIDRQFGKQPLISVILLAGVCTILYLEFKGLSTIVPFCEKLFEAYFFSPLTVYFLLFRLLKTNAYIESGNAVQSHTDSNFTFAFFKQFGEVGKWMQLEAKLIWRNKRSRMFLTLSLLATLYPFMMGLDSFDSNGMMIFLGLFMTGIFAMNYGQLLLSWNSSHFDLILTQNLSLLDYLKSKYYLLVLSCLFFSICTLPYAFFNLKFSVIILSMALYNVGVTIFIYLFLALYTSKKIDLAKGGMFNHEGLGAAHYLIFFPVLGIPMAIYAAFWFTVGADLAIIVLALIGIIGIAFHQKVLKYAAINMIKLSEIIKQYEQKVALEIADLDLSAGNICGIVGNNGAGKTTMFSLILDLIKPTKGQILSDGVNVADNENWKSYTGAYINESFLLDFLTPDEYFEFVADLYSWNKSTLDNFLHQFEELFNGEIIGVKKYIRDLSKGNQKKVGIVAALIGNPNVVILDEPFANLDPTTQNRLKQILISLKKSDRTILISSHDLNHIHEVSDRIIVLELGKIVKDINKSDSSLTELKEYFQV